MQFLALCYINYEEEENLSLKQPPPLSPNFDFHLILGYITILPHTLPILLRLALDFPQML